MVQRFAATARKRMRIDGGGYRRDHLRTFAQRVEVAEREVFIRGSKDELLRTLVAVGSGKSADSGVPSSVLKWRKGWDSNPRGSVNPLAVLKTAALNRSATLPRQCLPSFPAFADPANAPIATELLHSTRREGRHVAAVVATAACPVKLAGRMPHPYAGASWSEANDHRPPTWSSANRAQVVPPAGVRAAPENAIGRASGRGTV